MPKLQCNECKRLQKVPVREMKYLDPVPEDLLCSKQCVISKIGKSEMPEGAMANAYPLSMDRRDAAYSTILDMYFCSEYEKFVAESIVKLGVHFGIKPHQLAYEQYGFRMRDGGLYVPDFLILGRCLVEVKGKWGVGGKSKMLDFRREFPDIPFVFVHWGLRKEFYR